MRLFVLGATGATGTEILELARTRGHEVTAFVRSPQKLEKFTQAQPQTQTAPVKTNWLTIVPGDPRSREALTAALSGHDAVLSTIGPPPSEALRAGTTIVADCARATVAAMKAAGVDRLVIVSAAVLFPEKGLLFAFFRWLLRHHGRDLAAMEQIVTASGLDWTIARPPRLNRSRNTRVRVVPGANPPGGRVMSHRAVATFMIDAVERHAYSREIVGMAQ